MGEADFVFEVSFEICNKIGGIYTVIRSKVPYMVKEYDGGYHCIGFFDSRNAMLEFELANTPPQLEPIFKKLEEEGIKCMYGIWLIPGRPNTILVDAQNLKLSLDDIKKMYWEDYKIDSIRSDAWFNDPLKWGYAVGRLFQEMCSIPPYNNGKTVAHFHEWLAGLAMLYLRKRDVKIGTVFTTHATMLGRTISGSGQDLYKLVNKGIKEGKPATIDLAKKYGVEDKYSSEVACTNAAHVFTTVSDVTGKEAQYILGKKPDILLYNGLNISKYPEMEDLAVERKLHRKTMRGFLRAFFQRHYNLDLFSIRSAFISGRYEFHNKGIDVFIDALGNLNRRLKKEKSKKTFLAFVLVPSGTISEKIDLLKNKALYEEIVDTISEMLPEIKENLLDYVTTGNDLCADLLGEENLNHLHKLAKTFNEKSSTDPPLCAYDLSYPESNDAVLNALRKNDLWNRQDDRVKVVFYPAYLSETDRLISLDYSQTILTCDVGVFPSYYEPWGYTPLETAAQGTLAITSDLAGFGQFIKGKGAGVKVLDMDEREYDDIVKQLGEYLYEILNLPKRQMTKRRLNAKELACLADWEFLAKNYVKAHDLAIERLD